MAVSQTNPWESKENQRQSHNSLSGHPWSPTFSQAAPEKDNSQPGSDSWIGWLSCGHCYCQNRLDCFPGGLKDGAKFPALPWVKQKSSPAWVLLCLCHHSTGENVLQPPAVSFMKESMESRKIRVSMASQWVRNSVICIFWLYFKIQLTHNWSSVN